MYEYGGLNMTTCEAQWLEHGLISEGLGTSSSCGGILPKGSGLNKTTW